MANRNQGTNQDGSPRSGTSNRGFASMDAAQQREIARMGGAAVSGNREHMAQIGRKGGEASAESRANARSARSRTGTTGDGAAGGTPRDPDARGQADDGGQGRAQGERARGGEPGVGNRGLHARAHGDDEGGRRLAANARDPGRMLGASNMDNAVARNLGARGSDADAANRSLSGRSRDADDDSGKRGNAVTSPRGNRDDDR